MSQSAGRNFEWDDQALERDDEDLSKASGLPVMGERRCWKAVESMDEMVVNSVGQSRCQFFDAHYETVGVDRLHPVAISDSTKANGRPRLTCDGSGAVGHHFADDIIASTGDAWVRSVLRPSGRCRSQFPIHLVDRWSILSPELRMISGLLS
jgi:hypothetical protein